MLAVSRLSRPPRVAVVRCPASLAASMMRRTWVRDTPVIVTAGQVNDITQAPALLEGQAGKAVLADKTYDSNALRAIIAAMGAETVIPSNRSRKLIIAHDELTYRHRNRIERCFGRMKHCRRFATRYERRTVHFQGFIHLIAAMIWMQ